MGQLRTLRHGPSPDSLARRNSPGNPGGATPWQAGFGYDSRGLEVQRQLSGVSINWQHDALGRPTEQRITTGRGGSGATARQRRYHWQGSDQLARIEDSLLGSAAYGYNAQGYLTGANYSDGGRDTRQADAVGNLFDTQPRYYGPGGRLLSQGDSRYRYDAEGNLLEKQLPRSQGGGSWHYSWDSAGQLIRVRRPDGYAVQFGYDALGRRTQKLYRGKRTRWLWDGDVPLHEWSEYTVGTDMGSVDEVITWLFDPDSFAPLARLTPKSRLSVVADHLGTPLELIDEAGGVAWGAQLDAYGRIRRGTGQAGLCPFRYQGQYEDAETGLYYNRFRYYSPQEGMYISQDPIGIWGDIHPYSYVKSTSTALDRMGLAPGDVVPYNRKTTPNENHHGVLDVWSKHNIPEYPSRAGHNPTIELTKGQHDATKRAYRDWLEQRTGKRVGGRVDWTTVSPREVHQLSERMFDAAAVPQHQRDAYYKAFNRYIHNGCTGS